MSVMFLGLQVDFVFFFKQKTAYDRRMSDWSSDVCSSDLTGDGLLAALQVLAVLREAGKPMSALARQFEPVPQKLENVRFAGGQPLEDAAVVAAIASAEQRLNGAGRLLVRASGTEPLIRIMAEGDDEKLVSQTVKEIAGAENGRSHV